MANELQYNVKPIIQSNSKCCWLACYQMLYSWKSKPVAEVAKKIKAVNIDTDSGLDMSEWGKARAAMGLTGYRVGYLKEFENFYKIFSDHGPMWCAGRFLNNDPHAILVVGVHPDTQRIRCLDPYKLWQSGGEGFEYMTHKGWCGLIKNADFATQMWF